MREEGGEAYGVAFEAVFVAADPCGWSEKDDAGGRGKLRTAKVAADGFVAGVGQ